MCLRRNTTVKRKSIRRRAKDGSAPRVKRDKRAGESLKFNYFKDLQVPREDGKDWSRIKGFTLLTCLVQPTPVIINRTRRISQRIEWWFPTPELALGITKINHGFHKLESC